MDPNGQGDEDVTDAKTSSSIPGSFSRVLREAPTSPNLFPFLQHSTVQGIRDSPRIPEKAHIPWDSETSRLLYDDPYRAQYGSHIQNIQRPVYQPDPESVKREREALDGICHAMSDNLIDVFTIQPQPASPGPSDRSISLVSQANVTTNGDFTSEDVRLNTIRRGRGGPVLSTIGRSSVVSKAVHEAIG